MSATHCNTQQHTATHSGTLQHSQYAWVERCHYKTQYMWLQHAATHSSTLQHTAAHCNTVNMRESNAVTIKLNTCGCNTLQHTAALQHTTAHCNTVNMHSSTATHNGTLQHSQYAWVERCHYKTHTHSLSDPHTFTLSHGGGMSQIWHERLHPWRGE